MGFSGNKIFRWTIYLAYGLILTAALLYLRFPAEKFKTLSADFVEKLIPGTECVIEDMQFHFPFTFVINDLHLKITDQPEGPTFTVKSTKIRPSLQELGKEFQISTELFDKEQDWTLKLTGDNGEFTVSNLDIKKLDLFSLSYLQEKMGRRITGIVDLSAEYSGILGQPHARMVRGSAKIQNGSLELIYPILFLEKIDLEKAELRFFLTGNKVEISAGKFSGRKLEGTFSGSTNLIFPIFDSNLNLRGNITPMPALSEDDDLAGAMVDKLLETHKLPFIPFRAYGTMAEPKFNFGS